MSHRITKTWANHVRVEQYVTCFTVLNFPTFSIFAHIQLPAKYLLNHTGFSVHQPLSLSLSASLSPLSVHMILHWNCVYEISQQIINVTKVKETVSNFKTFARNCYKLSRENLILLLVTQLFSLRVQYRVSALYRPIAGGRDLKLLPADTSILW